MQLWPGIQIYGAEKMMRNAVLAAQLAFQVSSSDEDSAFLDSFDFHVDSGLDYCEDEDLVGLELDDDLVLRLAEGCDLSLDGVDLNSIFSYPFQPSEAPPVEKVRRRLALKGARTDMQKTKRAIRPVSDGRRGKPISPRGFLNRNAGEIIRRALDEYSTTSGSNPADVALPKFKGFIGSNKKLCLLDHLSEKTLRCHLNAWKKERTA